MRCLTYNAGLVVTLKASFLLFLLLPTPRDSHAEEIFAGSIDRRVYLEAENHLKWGRQLRAAGDLELAVREFEEAVRLNPMESRAWRELGLASIDRGDVRGALENLDQAVSIDPSDVPSYLARARVWLLLGRTGRAEEDAAKARALDEDDPSVLVACGDILSSLGRRFEALEAYEESNRQDPHPVVPLRRLGRLYYNLGMDDFALQAYGELRALEALDKEDAECMARLHSRLAGAPRALAAGLNADPVSGEPYFDLGEWFLRQGNLEASGVCFFLALSRNPHDFDAAMNLGYIAYAEGDYISAYAWYDSLRGKGREDAALLYNMGLTSLKLQNNSLAADLLEDAARMEPARPEIYLLLAKTYHILGLPDRTVGAVTEYLRLRPDAPDAAEWLEYLEEVKSELGG